MTWVYSSSCYSRAQGQCTVLVQNISQKHPSFHCKFSTIQNWLHLGALNSNGWAWRQNINNMHGSCNVTFTLVIINDYVHFALYYNLENEFCLPFKLEVGIHHSASLLLNFSNLYSPLAIFCCSNQLLKLLCSVLD